MLQKIADSLALRLSELPKSGPKYVAQNPFYAIYIGALLSGNHRQLLFSWLETIARKPVTNARRPLEALPRLWMWMDTNIRSDTMHDWMEEMFRSLSPDYQNISLG